MLVPYSLYVNHELISQDYHCSEIRTLSMSKICTSCAIGFYIRDRYSFDNFKKELTDLSHMQDTFFYVVDKPK